MEFILPIFLDLSKAFDMAYMFRSCHEVNWCLYLQALHRCTETWGGWSYTTPA